MILRHIRLAVIVILALTGATAAVGVWLLSRPLPETTPPHIDEARDRPTDEHSQWHRAIFKRLNEPPIESVSPGAIEVYRLILLPTFDEPIVVQVAKTSDGIHLRTKVLDGMGGYGLDEMGKTSDAVTQEIAEEDFERLRALMADASFWEIPVQDPDDIPVLDGAYWIFEGRDRGVVRSISRITPKPKLLVVFRYLLQLARKEKHYRGYWPDDAPVAR